MSNRVFVKKLGRANKAARAYRRVAGPIARIPRQMPQFTPSRGGAVYARRMGPAEKKNIDQLNVSLGPTAVGTTTGVVTLLNGCVTGGQPINRIGRRICMTSVLIRGRLNLAATSAGNCQARIVVFYDKQTNKAAPVATDVLANDLIESPMTLANTHRFRVLRDIVVPCLGTAGPQCHYVDEYIKLPPGCRDAEFIDGAGAGTVADITSGGLFTLVYLQNFITVAAVSQAFDTRVRFTDY